MAEPTHVTTILFLAANPKNTGRLRLDEEVRDIQEGLQLSSGRDHIRFEAQWAIRLKDLRRSLLKHTPHIVHFSGHGAGAEGLVLEDEAGYMRCIKTDTLAQLFKLCPSVQCVVLNACYSQVQAKAIAQHVPCVIGMNQAIADETAIKFAVGFYDALGYGRTLAEAYEFGMTAIETQPSTITRDIAAHPEEAFAAIPDPVTPILIQTALPSRMTPLAATLSRKEYRDRQALLNKVKTYWIKGVLERSLHNQVLIELGLEERLDFANPFHLAVGMVDEAPKPLNQNMQPIDVFDDLGAGRSLLILGEPGSGKTITLLQLTRDLLTRAEQNPDHLIPVVFNLSSWNGQQSIADWLIEELNTKYQVPKAIGKPWVMQRQLLLLLDGLDEVAIAEREACVIALNHFQQTRGTEMVVCSRIKDYEALAQRLTVQQAIYVRSLQTAQIDGYLESLDADLNGLKELLKNDEALQELARSPLILNIMVLAYEGAVLTNLPQTPLDVTEHRQQLFDIYIQRMFRRRTIHKRYPESQSRKWLEWLARQMQEQSKTIFLIEEMQDSWFKSRVQCVIYHSSIKSLTGLIYGLALGLNYSLAFNIQEGIIVGLIGAITVGLFFRIGNSLPIIFSNALVFIIPATYFASFEDLFLDLLFGIFYGALGAIVGHLIQAEIKPVETLRWSLKSYSVHNKVDLVVLLFTILACSIWAIFFWAIFGNALGVIFGCLAALAGFLMTGFTRGVVVKEKTFPNQGIWLSAIYDCPFILAGGVLGVFFYSFWENTNSPQENLVSVLGGFILGSILFGLFGGGGAGIIVIKHFVVRFSLWCDRKLPWNYAQFLDFAVDHILLQKVGGGYIFIHRSLMEHFAQLEP